jgi:hypothetical protein
MIACHAHKETKNISAPMAYLSKVVRYDTVGSFCVTIHLKLIDDKISKQVV